MAVYVAGKDVYFLLGTVALSGSAVLSEVSLRESSDELDVSTIGQNWKQFLQGQSELTLDLTGVWEAGTAGASPIDAIFHGMVNAGGTKLYEFMPQGSATDRTLYKGNCTITGYEISAPVAGAVGFTVSLRGAGSVTRTLAV